jgi:hypothetical protein
MVLVVLVAAIAAPVRAPVRMAIGAVGGIAAVAVARTGGIESMTGPALVAVAIAVPLSLLAAFGVVTVSRRTRWGESASDR